jgi:hypothetical protein
MPGVDVGHHRVSLTGSWSLFLSVFNKIFLLKNRRLRVHEENGERAAALLHRTVLREGCYDTVSASPTMVHNEIPDVESEAGKTEDHWLAQSPTSEQR